LREALDGVRDVERLAGRAAAGRATPRELGALRDSFQRLPDVAGALNELAGSPLPHGGQSVALAQAADELDLLADLSTHLVAALAERLPATLADGGVIRPGYDTELDELTEAGSTSPRCSSGSASAPASPRSRSDSTRCSATTSR
jgi:DNA mismatch repair protein MutS